MASIKLQGDTSGELTISAPAVAGTNTLTLPASTGTLATTADIPAGGKILQVVSTTSSTSTSTTSTSYVDTSLSLAITPSATSSKIMILVSGLLDGQSDNNIIGGMALVRGATVILDDGETIRIGVNANVGIRFRTNMAYLDSPNTTSATTYKIQIKRVSLAGTSYSIKFGNTASVATITLLEVAG